MTASFLGAPCRACSESPRAFEGKIGAGNHGGLHDRFCREKRRDLLHVLVKHGVRKVIDIRLSNVSQLAGFTKKNDLKYFLKVIANIEYEYLPQLASTKELMDGFRGGKIPWEEYEVTYLALLEERQVLKNLKPEDFDKDACFAAKKSRTTATEGSRQSGCKNIGRG